MISRDYLDNPAVAAFLALLAARGIGWQFGTNDPAGFLAARGWTARPEDTAARAAAASRNFYIDAERAAS